MNNISVKVNFRNQETKTYDDVKMIFVNDTKLWLITDDCDNATILNKKTILGFETLFEKDAGAAWTIKIMEEQGNE